MAVTITDGTSTIRLDYGSGVIEDISKGDISSIMPINVPDVTDFWADKQYVLIKTTGGTEYKIYWKEVTSPTVVSVSDLNAQLVAMWKAGTNNQTFVAQALYDYSVHGGAISTIGLGVFIPNNAIVKMTYLQVVTTIDSAAHGGTIAIGYTGDTDAFLAPTGDPIAAGYVAGIQDGTVAKFHQVTAMREIAITIAGEVMTSGKAYIYAEYVVPA